MGRPIQKGSTDQSTVIRIIDSTTFAPETAVEHNTAGIDLWWRREAETKTAITEAALAALDSAHSDGGIEHIGDGYYRLDLPDAAVAVGAGENSVQIGGTVTGMIVIGNEHALVDYDPYDDSTGAGGSPLVIGRGDLGDFKEDAVVYFLWNTVDRARDAVAPSTAGTLKVYKDDGTAEVTAPTGITDGRAHDGVTGLHDCKIDLDSGTQAFYEKGKNYTVLLSAAVIDTKTVNTVIASFSIENRWANVHFHYGGH